MNDSPRKGPFSVSLKKISVYQFTFWQIDLYDLQELEGELRKIILQKYRFYNPFNRSGTSQKVKIRHFGKKQILFAQLLMFRTFRTFM